METRISSDDDIPLNLFFSWLEVKVVEDGAIEFTLFKNIILVYDLNKEKCTPIILADF